jgi:TetR/AcrR family transcriptional regulator, regulator of mycofactocin system
MSRRPASSRADIERVAIRLFDEQGYDEATVDDIAAAAGISRRTFFRYFPSKNDVVWGDFDAGLVALRKRLAETPEDVPVMTALRDAVVEFNHIAPDDVPWHRRRMALILHVDALQAHSTLMYAAWRAVIADYVATRSHTEPDDFGPQLVAYTVLGAAVAAYEQWLRDPGADLATLLGEAMERLGAGLAAGE